jgi:hypothetical protein
MDRGDVSSNRGFLGAGAGGFLGQEGATAVARVWPDHLRAGPIPEPSRRGHEPG